MLKLKLIHQALILVALTMLPVPAFAISQLSISWVGDGVYVLRGTLEKASAIQVYITYDTSTLSNPRVTVGSLMSGAMTEVNPANPIVIGGVHVAGINGSGTIATITFDRVGAFPAKINALSAKLFDAQLHTLALAEPVINNPTQAVGSSDTTDTTKDTKDTKDTRSDDTKDTTTDTTTRPFVVGGTMSYPASESAAPTAGEESVKDVPPHFADLEMQDRSVQQQVAAAAAPEPAEAEAPAAAVPSQSAPAAKPIQSVLERFKLFSGEKTVPNYLALFVPDSSVPFTQSPAVAIADGKGSVKVRMTKLSGKKAPNFALKSARFVSLARVGEGEWELELVPEKGAVEASVTVMSEGGMQEFPVTVAPKAEGMTSDFALFLKERGSAAAPKFDLNGDGKRDYLDDYIFTANYLVKAGAKGKAQ